jgi:glucose-6-phosphate isomerase
MELPDETIGYQYHSLLTPNAEEWGPASELRAQHFLDPARVRALVPQLLQIRSQVAAERELREAPAELRPLEAGFIDLPQNLLDGHRRKGDASELGRILAEAAQLRSQVERVVIVGAGGSYRGARALFEALRSSYHNELQSEARMGVPRIYFEGNNLDNDSFHELLELLQTTCVDPELREERWGAVIISKSGGTLETAVAYRIMRSEAEQYYGHKYDGLRQLLVPITGSDGKFRDLCKAEGHADADILTIPEGVGSRFSVFTPAGLLPAAVMGLDARALLLGAAAMTRRFVEEPFERNSVLQFAGINHLMATEKQKPIRVFAVWSKKLEAFGAWYDQLLAESLGKQGKGPTPLTAVHSRDLHSRGQQYQNGSRDKMINNLVLKTPRTAPIQVGMADRNEDELNALSRKTLPDLLDAALRGSMQGCWEDARPAANLIVPSLTEHSLGQLMQMMMLATVVEARLLGINPYGQPGIEAFKRNMKECLKK